MSPRRRLVVEADGGSRGNPGPAGWGALVRDGATGQVLTERAGYLGVASNNVAEYAGLVAGLHAAREIDPEAAVEVRMDSRLVVEQMTGRWKVKHADMQRLVAEARDVLPPQQVTYAWVARAENAAADALANEAMDARGVVRRDHVPLPDAAEGPRAGTASGRGVGTSGDARGSSTPGRVPLRQRRPSGAAMRFDDAEPVTVVLVRHGATAMTENKGLSGSSEPGPPLAPAGRVQAAQAADAVYRIGLDLWPDVLRPSAVVASPMVRTQETAAAVGRRMGLPVTVDPAFAECDFGAWQGMTPDEVEAAYPGELRRWYTDPAFPAAEGESMAHVGARVGEALARLAESHTGRTVVVVSHVMAIRAAVGLSLRMAPEAWVWLRVVPASLSVVRWWPDGMREAVAIGMPTDA